MAVVNPDYPLYPNQKNFETVADIAELYGQAVEFVAERSVGRIIKSNKKWREPDMPDAQVYSWLRAATALDACDAKNAEQYRKMIILLEAAARRGCYQAALLLKQVYQEGRRVRGGFFKPDLKKARAWLFYGLEQRWSGALEWLANAGFPPSIRLMYLQQAAEAGVAAAQYQLAQVIESRMPQSGQGDALLRCAATQDEPRALYELGLIHKVEGDEEAACIHFQRALMMGGNAGGEAACALQYTFLTEDSTREKAYKALSDALLGSNDGVDGNPNLRFPMLDSVLPLPPKAINWTSPYEAMDADDAAYYRQPPDPDVYLDEINEGGWRVADSYLEQSFEE